MRFHSKSIWFLSFDFLRFPRSIKDFNGWEKKISIEVRVRYRFGQSWGERRMRIVWIWIKKIRKSFRGWFESCVHWLWRFSDVFPSRFPVTSVVPNKWIAIKLFIYFQFPISRYLRLLIGLITEGCLKILRQPEDGLTKWNPFQPSCTHFKLDRNSIFWVVEKEKWRQNSNLKIQEKWKLNFF